MKTTVVPAQITTVEDRIAGNLTLPQIVLLIVPLIIGATIYVCLPIRMHINTIKIVLICFQFLFFGLLAIRFRGKIIADWSIIYLRFKLRPRRYIFTKNDPATREIEPVVIEEPANKNVVEQKPEIIPALPISPDKTKVDRMFTNPTFNASYKLSKNGGLDVTLSQIEH
jgi:hypothetical protein